MLPTPIIQFGTSRFLQAHACLFISEALDRGEASGPITIVQTTGSAERASRLSGLAAPGGFPVIIRGIESGQAIERTEMVKSVARALSAQIDWPEITRIFIEEAEAVISNTGETGYDISAEHSTAPNDGRLSPSFPGKLLDLLQARFLAGGKPITILPCELIPRNGDVLKATLQTLAQKRECDAAFVGWLQTAVVFANTLVDRIVSEPIEPAGAIAEPYALWAIEKQEGLVMPFSHPNVILADDLTPFLRLKLHILNLGHTVLADKWLEESRPELETVREILAEADNRDHLRSIYQNEIVPGFAAHGMGSEAERYMQTTIERFLNPTLNHRLRDISSNHKEKIRRRIIDFIDWAAEAGDTGEKPELARIVTRNGLWKE